MENKKEQLEDFKTAISSTVRSLSNLQKIEVSFGNQISKNDENSIKLPDIVHDQKKFNFEAIRAIADSKSKLLDCGLKIILFNWTDKLSANIFAYLNSSLIELGKDELNKFL